MRSKHAFLAASAAAWLFVGPGRASASDFYVSASADSCTNPPGTLEQPYCSIVAALAAHHTPGTRIFVLPGVYHEQVTVPASGTASDPIVLQALSSDGEPVVIDGSNDLSDPSLWTPYAGDVWLAPSVDWSPVQVFADSTRLTPASVEPDQLPPGSFTSIAGEGLYVN